MIASPDCYLLTTIVARRSTNIVQHADSSLSIVGIED